jgi:hypothetical protein
LFPCRSRIVRRLAGVSRDDPARRRLCIG